MIRLFVVIFLLSICLKIQASELDSPNEKILCSTFYGLKYRKEVKKLPNDKTMHCAISCMMARHCPNLEVATVGYLKELLDALGMGTPDQEDIRANRTGIRFAPKSRSKEDCKTLCLAQYGPPN